MESIPTLLRCEYHVHMHRDQILSCACIHLTQGSKGDRSASWENNQLWKTLFVHICFSRGNIPHLHCFVFNVTRGHVLYCLLLLYTIKKQKKEYFSSQSQMLYLIQLCLFISLEGFNRWKRGSSVYNKLDKQTRNRVEFQKCCLSTLRKKKSWNKCVPRVWICSFKVLFIFVNRRLRSWVCLFHQHVDISFWNRTLHLITCCVWETPNQVTE